MTFAETIDSWHDFYVLIGTAAVTLMGLLFVGLSINLGGFQRYDDMRALSRQTFINFLYTLGVAAIFLIPNQSLNGVALPLIGFGLSGLGVTIQQSRNSRNSKEHVYERSIVPRFRWSLVCFLALVVIAVTILMGYTDGLYWLVAVILILMLGAARSAWDLLVGIPAPEKPTTPSGSS